MAATENPGHSAHPSASAPAAPRRGLRPLTIGAAVVAIFAVLFAIGLVPRLQRRAALSASAGEARPEGVPARVVQPKRVPRGGELILPGNVQARQETALFARTNGFVRRWLVDIGDTVKEGQLLAEIDTPELDQELRQAHAKLAEARAGVEHARTSLELTRLNVDRYERLAPEGIASQRELDERRAAHRVAQANLRAAEAALGSQAANAQRLAELRGFAKITAPFAGRVTARTAEVGALVTAGNAQGQGLFRVAEVDPLRVFVHVPQSAATGVRAGQDASVTMREYPGKVFTGKVTRTAGALDPATRTLLTEVQIPNEGGAVLPGMYAQVRLNASTTGGDVLRVPGAALLFGARGPEVATVGPDDRVHLVQVQLGADHGVEVEIVAGLSGEDRIVANPSGGVVEGARIAPSGTRVAASASLTPPR